MCFFEGGGAGGGGERRPYTLCFVNWAAGGGGESVPKRGHLISKDRDCWKSLVMLSFGHRSRNFSVQARSKRTGVSLLDVSDA